MKKFRIGYFADGPWSHNAFQLLIADPAIEIAFIVPRSDSQDETLLNFSKQYNIPYFKGYKINSTDFRELVLPFNCDLFVSMSFNQIFGKEIASLPPMGTINCHAGKLPFYRGRNILNWALINDEKSFGITVHFIDEGIDTGDIILQRDYPISDADDYATLLNVSHTACADILYEAIVQLKNGTFKRLKQTDIHPVGFYCGPRAAGDEMIHWNQTSRELFNFIRAVCKPGPMATTTCRGTEVKINRAVMIENAPAYKNTIGQIVGKTSRGFIVKTADTVIEIFEIESAYQLKMGDRLGT
jgi:methionyl-tRNA formyltransferase